MAIIRISIFSKMLNMHTNITAVVPSLSENPGATFKYEPGAKYQALYLLHGGGGDDSDYILNTNIARYARQNKIVAIMPCNYNMAYTNDPGGYQYFTYITDELPEICRAMLPISERPEDTFIGGLSMGSHGAMKAAVTYPERYKAALIMSGAAFRPGVPIAVKAVNGQFDMDAPQFVPPGITGRLLDEDFIRDTENDVYKIARENALAGKKLPKLFFRVGDNDHALYRTLLAVKDLNDWGYDTDLEVIKGYGHVWDLWELTLREALNDWFPIRRAAVQAGK